MSVLKKRVLAASSLKCLPQLHCTPSTAVMEIQIHTPVGCKSSAENHSILELLWVLVVSAFYPQPKFCRTSRSGYFIKCRKYTELSKLLSKGPVLSEEISFSMLSFAVTLQMVEKIALSVLHWGWSHKWPHQNNSCRGNGRPAVSYSHPAGMDYS